MSKIGISASDIKTKEQFDNTFFVLFGTNSIFSNEFPAIFWAALTMRSLETLLKKYYPDGNYSNLQIIVNTYNIYLNYQYLLLPWYGGRETSFFEFNRICNSYDGGAGASYGRNSYNRVIIEGLILLPYYEFILNTNLEVSKSNLMVLDKAILLDIIDRVKVKKDLMFYIDEERLLLIEESIIDSMTDSALSSYYAKIFERGNYKDSKELVFKIIDSYNPATDLSVDVLEPFFSMISKLEFTKEDFKIIMDFITKKYIPYSLVNSYLWVGLSTNCLLGLLSSKFMTDEIKASVRQSIIDTGINSIEILNFVLLYCSTTQEVNDVWNIVSQTIKDTLPRNIIYIKPVVNRYYSGSDELIVSNRLTLYNLVDKFDIDIYETNLVNDIIKTDFASVPIEFLVGKFVRDINENDISSVPDIEESNAAITSVLKKLDYNGIKQWLGISKIADTIVLHEREKSLYDRNAAVYIYEAEINSIICNLFFLFLEDNGVLINKRVEKLVSSIVNYNEQYFGIYFIIANELGIVNEAYDKIVSLIKNSGTTTLNYATCAKDLILDISNSEMLDKNMKVSTYKYLDNSKILDIIFYDAAYYSDYCNKKEFRNNLLLITRYNGLVEKDVPEFDVTHFVKTMKKDIKKNYNESFNEFNAIGADKFNLIGIKEYTDIFILLLEGMCIDNNLLTSKQDGIVPSIGSFTNLYSNAIETYFRYYTYEDSYLNVTDTQNEKLFNIIYNLNNISGLRDMYFRDSLITEMNKFLLVNYNKFEDEIFIMANESFKNGYRKMINKKFLTNAISLMSDREDRLAIIEKALKNFGPSNCSTVSTVRSLYSKKIFRGIDLDSFTYNYNGYYIETILSSYAKLNNTDLIFTILHHMSKENMKGHVPSFILGMIEILGDMTFDVVNPIISIAPYFVNKLDFINNKMLASEKIDNDVFVYCKNVILDIIDNRRWASSNYYSRTDMPFIIVDGKLDFINEENISDDELRS